MQVTGTDSEDRQVSIVRIGLAEKDGFGEGYDAIFGKKKKTTGGTEAEVTPAAKKTPAKPAAAAAKNAPAKVAAKPPAAAAKKTPAKKPATAKKATPAKAKAKK